MRKITKKQSMDFVFKAHDVLEDLGATTMDVTDSYVVMSLDTEVGELIVKIDKDNQFCYTVFSKFEDVERAREVVNCNPYSGKYNLHRGDSETELDDIMSMVMDHFECVLPVKKHTD